MSGGRLIGMAAVALAAAFGCLAHDWQFGAFVAMAVAALAMIGCLVGA